MSLKKAVLTLVLALSTSAGWLALPPAQAAAASHQGHKGKGHHHKGHKGHHHKGHKKAKA